MIRVPDELRYSRDHQWVRREEAGALRTGLTAWAQEAIGDVVMVDLTAGSDELGEGAELGVVEANKAVSDVYMPVAGVVIEVNQALAGDAALINRDPYGDGWLARLMPTDPAEVDALLDAEAYRRLVTGDVADNEVAGA